MVDQKVPPLSNSGPFLTCSDEFQVALSLANIIGKKAYIVAAALLSLVGLVDALYLTIEHITGQIRPMHDHRGLLGCFE